MTTTAKGNRTRERVRASREQLLSDLAREPTQGEVAAHCGSARTRVQQIYVEQGIDAARGAAALRAEVKAPSLARAAAIAARKLARLAVHEEIMRLHAEGLSQAEIVKQLQISQSLVTKVLLARGVPPGRRMFTTDEDALVQSDRPVQAVARELGRANATIYLRRKRLAARGQS